MTLCTCSAGKIIGNQFVKFIIVNISIKCMYKFKDNTLFDYVDVCRLL